MTKEEAELNIFLLKHPHLALYQKRLEKEMDDYPDEARIMVISRHLIDNLDELSTELQLLQYKLVGKNELSR